jgi:hypothetical protein
MIHKARMTVTVDGKLFHATEITFSKILGEKSIIAFLRTAKEDIDNIQPSDIVAMADFPNCARVK